MRSCQRFAIPLPAPFLNNKRSLPFPPFLFVFFWPAVWKFYSARKKKLKERVFFLKKRPHFHRNSNSFLVQKKNCPVVSFFFQQYTPINAQIAEKSPPESPWCSIRRLKLSAWKLDVWNDQTADQEYEKAWNYHCYIIYIYIYKHIYTSFRKNIFHRFNRN